ncbi:hypothetical protein CTAYLR_002605 [Chrysophaeum taylorii]|uniref:Hsp70-Hsp90 organising protein n=1 Tax=Chrysophaeum taylorii TaxID=2483200 RepID=A0AAD7UD35_9STRA|nr:hypothetical protein CTAYLR_002605 [Chrysophaeum taylorii]
MAEAAKALGNKALQAKQYDEAVAHYTQAIELDPQQHTYYSNRAAALTSKGDYSAALSDAEKCISLKPEWPKGYSRKGAALHAMKRYEEAKTAYEAGLTVAPQDGALRQGLADVTKLVQNPFAKAFGQDLIPRIAQHPTLRHKLGDATFMTKLRILQSNPQQAMSTMFSDPDMQAVISLALGLDIHMPKEGEDEEPSPMEEAAPAPAPAPPPAVRTPEEQKELDAKEAAREWKAKGNALYKEKKFDQALEMYDKAIETDPSDVTYLNNKLAAYFEQKLYDKVIEEGEKAIAVGREHRADFEVLAKIYVRMGKAAAKTDKQRALEFYRSAQVEHFTKDTERTIKLMELEMRKAKALAYVDPEKAIEAKEKGNVAFRGGDFPTAIREYEEAVKRDPKNPSYYNNLAAALSKIGDFQGAKQNCDKALEIDPNYVKAICKRADIEFLMKEYHKALESYKKGLSIEPDNAACKQGLQKVTVAINQGGADQERTQHAMADPEIQAILQDPVIRTIISQMSTDPTSANKALADPLIRAKIEKLIASGILQVK